MKKNTLSLLVATALLGSLLTACSSNTNVETPTATPSPTPSENVEITPSPEVDPTVPQNPDENKVESSTDKIMNTILEKIEQPGLFDLSSEELEDFYGINSEIVDEFTVKTPAVNLIANEIAVIKVKDDSDIDTVKKSMEQRASEVQKMFENYLPEPYKQAQNYKIITKGKYVLFVISESAEDLVKAFNEIAE